MMDRATEATVAELAECVKGKFYGKYRGIVRDVDDPEGMGRVKVDVPDVYGDEVSPWALPVAPFAGAGHGFIAIPEPDDGVFVEFEQGDPSRPLWTGGWWARGELPAPGGVNTRVLATSRGHQLILDDDGGEVKLVHGDGAEITLTGSQISLKIGGKEIVLDGTSLKVNGGSLEVT